MKFIAIIASLLLLSILVSTELQESIERGQPLYKQFCATCHMQDGTGMEGVYPPLANADYLMADKKRAIIQILYGVSGPMEVNGHVYDDNMTPFEDLDDQDIADIMNYIRNSWGNEAKDIVTAKMVKKARK